MKRHIYLSADIDRSLRTGEPAHALCGIFRVQTVETVAYRPDAICVKCNRVLEKQYPASEVDHTYKPVPTTAQWKFKGDI